jgi:hypothetical protein
LASNMLSHLCIFENHTRNTFCKNTAHFFTNSPVSLIVNCASHTFEFLWFISFAISFILYYSSMLSTQYVYFNIYLKKKPKWREY